MKKALKFLAGTAAALLLLEFLLLLSFSRPENPQQRDPAFVKGVYHLHSLFSDGLGDRREIAEAAGGLGLDFVILTDHGRPNLDSARSTLREAGTLLIGGSELTVRGGHLAAAGFDPPGYLFALESQDAIDEISLQETGLTFLAHPFDRRIPWTEPEVRGMTGIEIISYYQQVKRMFPPRLLSFFLLYPLNPDYALSSHLRFPKRELAFWDELNREGDYLGIHALDAHAKLPLGPWKIKFPSYRAMFRVLNLYVRTGVPLPAEADRAAALVLRTIKAGNFYNVVESLASADGFDCFFEPDNGPPVSMGGTSRESAGEFVFKLPFPFACRLVLYRDGNPVESRNSRGITELRIPAAGPGVYRAELYLRRLRFSRIPWVITNPFFLRTIVKPEPPEQAELAKFWPDPPPAFRPEKNPASDLDMEQPQTNTLNFSFSLLPDSAQNPDFWVAAADRENRDWRDASGISFTAEASVPLRVWLQFRSKSEYRENFFERSILIGPEQRCFILPFNTFFGPEYQPEAADLRNITAFFFLLDGRLAYPESRGVFKISDLSLFR